MLLPTYIRLVEVSYGQSVMEFVVGGGDEFTKTYVVVLWLFEEEETTGRVTHPERGVGVYMHAGFLEYLEEFFVFLKDV